MRDAVGVIWPRGSRGLRFADLREVRVPECALVVDAADFEAVAGFAVGFAASLAYAAFADTNLNFAFGAADAVFQRTGTSRLDALRRDDEAFRPTLRDRALVFGVADKSLDEPPDEVLDDVASRAACAAPLTHASSSTKNPTFATP